jgi:signal peptidase I
MRPTVLEGDVVLVDRLAYDFKVPLTDISLLRLGEPRRGDVITFTSPADGARLIKRLVGLPGDVVELRDDRLIVNGVPAEYTDAVPVTENLGAFPVEGVRAIEHLGGRAHAVQFLPQVPSRRNAGPFVVPAEGYFFLGDNRDNSADSRYIGFVPRRLLIGRAHHLLVSADIAGHWLPRLDRFGQAIE